MFISSVAVNRSVGFGDSLTMGFSNAFQRVLHRKACREHFLQEQRLLLFNVQVEYLSEEIGNLEQTLERSGGEMDAIVGDADRPQSILAGVSIKHTPN